MIVSFSAHAPPLPYFMKFRSTAFAYSCRRTYHCTNPVPPPRREEKVLILYSLQQKQRSFPLTCQLWYVSSTETLRAGDFGKNLTISIHDTNLTLKITEMYYFLNHTGLFLRHYPRLSNVYLRWLPKQEFKYSKCKSDIVSVFFCPFCALPP